MKTLTIIPDGIREIKEVYGNPDLNEDFVLDGWFVKERLTVFDLPYPMRLSWKPDIYVRRIQAHIDIGEVIIDALKEILDKVGYDYLVSNAYDVYGGCFNFRPKRGANALSTHSWGIAIDLNPHIAPFGEKGKQPLFIIDAFAKRGFEWGGTWDNPDPMHFQACRGY